MTPSSAAAAAAAASLVSVKHCLRRRQPHRFAPLSAYHQYTMTTAATLQLAVDLSLLELDSSVIDCRRLVHVLLSHCGRSLVRQHRCFGQT